ncbi:MAG: cytochrome P450, partial [Pseudomonadota bacterium]
FEKYKSKKLNASCFYGGTPYNQQMEEIRNGIDILIGTPGRILDHLSNENIDLSKLRYDLSFLTSVRITKKFVFVTFHLIGIILSFRVVSFICAVREFCDYLRDLIARRAAAPGDPDTDVLTRLMRGDRGEHLTEVQLLHNCIFILNAGHETTTNLIGNALDLFLDHPDQRARLIAEPELIDSTVEEVLRHQSSNQLGNRITTTETEIGGLTLAPGTRVHLMMGAANRDPDQFPDPDSFDIARAPNKHLAFAGGPHICLGLTLARLEGKIAIERFLARYPDYTRTAPAIRTGRMRFRGFSHLPVRLTS